MKDVQRLLLDPYSGLPDARYVPLRFTNGQGARRWLRWLMDNRKIAMGGNERLTEAAQIAFTYPGLAKLEATRSEDDGDRQFSAVFQNGMAERKLFLQDVNLSDPKSWAWGTDNPGSGGGANLIPDALLLLFDKFDKPVDPANAITRWTAREEALLKSATGVVPLAVRPPDAGLIRSADGGYREHFGFRDGISEPRLEGVDYPSWRQTPSSKWAGETGIAPGEFILGERNERGLLSGEELPRWTHHGSFLVFRQLQQLVRSFWATARETVVDDPADFAARMIGRRMNGTPLCQTPDGTPIAATDNSFRLGETDPRGFACPIGSHIARANPRDRLADRPPVEAIKFSRMRQIIRRARSYGTPLDIEKLIQEDSDPKTARKEDLKLDKSSPTANERGLHFIALCANIELQFEFIQHSWLQNPRFGSLEQDPDPIVGQRSRKGARFTIETHVGPRRSKLPPFVIVRGGGYFFMPSATGLEVLAGGKR